MNRFFILSVSLGLGMLQAACGSSKTTATSSGAPGCEKISDADIAAIFPKSAASSDPNIKLIYGSLGTNADATFAAVTASIVTNAFEAPTTTLGTSFQTLMGASTERKQEFTAHLQSFLASAFGGPEYTGPDMVTAHSDLDITVAQYQAFLTDVVVPALATNKVPQATVDLMTPVVTDPDFVKTVVSCK